MRFDQLVDQGPDLVEAELRGGVRVEHGSMIDMLPFPGQRGFHDQRLHVDIRLLQRGELRRHPANFGRLKPVLIHKTRDFDTTALREIVDQSIVGHIAIHDARRSGFHGVDDERAIFLAALIALFIQLTALQGGLVCLPLGDLDLAALDVLIQRDLDIPRSDPDGRA